MNKNLIWIIAILTLIILPITQGAWTKGTDDLILVYTFDNADLSGSNPVNLINSVAGVTGNASTGASGKEGEAFSFDGTNDFVYADDNYLSGLTDVTISMWVYFDNVGSVDQLATVHNPANDLQIRADSGKMRMFLSNDEWVGSAYFYQTLDAGAWQHIVITYDTDANERHFYLNGTLWNTSSVADPISSTAKLVLGGIASDGSQSLNGDLDEVYIWDVVLTDDGCSIGSACGGDIGELWNSGTGLFYDGFASAPEGRASFKFYDAINDSAMSEFNLTLSNGTTTLLYNTTNGTIEDDNNLTGYYNLTYNIADYYNVPKTYENIYVNSTLVHNASDYQQVLEILAREIISLDLLFSFTATREGFNCNATAGSCYLPARAGYQDIVINATGYMNKTKNDGYLSGTGGPIVVSGMYVDYLELKAIAPNGSTISNFTINYSSDTYSYSGSVSTTNGSVFFYLLNGSYSFLYDASGYGYEIYNYNATLGTHQHNESLLISNSFYFSFYDELNLSLLSGINCTLDLISSPFGENYSTTNGTLIMYLLVPAEYVIRYDCEGYSPKFFYSELEDRNSYNMSLYLMQDGIASNITATVYDEYYKEVEGAFIYSYRYDISTNTYNLVEIVKTNFEGEATLHLQKNYEFYKFSVYYDNELKYTTSESYITKDSINLQVVTGSLILTDYYASLSVAYNLSYDNETQMLLFYYSGSNITQGCLIVESEDLSVSFMNCTLNTSTSIYQNMSNYSNTLNYIVSGVITINGQDYTLSSLIIPEYKDVLDSGAYGVFLVLLLTFAMGFLAVIRLELFLIALPMPLFLMSLIGFIAFPVSYAGAIWIAFGILAFVINKT